MTMSKYVKNEAKRCFYVMRNKSSVISFLKTIKSETAALESNTWMMVARSQAHYPEVPHTR